CAAVIAAQAAEEPVDAPRPALLEHRPTFRGGPHTMNIEAGVRSAHWGGCRANEARGCVAPVDCSKTPELFATPARRGSDHLRLPGVSLVTRSSGPLAYPGP